MGKLRLVAGVVVMFLTAFPIAAKGVLPLLTVEAEGQVAVAPNMAVITVGVEVQAAKAKPALKLSSARMKQVFALLKKRGISPKDIQTSQFSLRPQWHEQKSTYDQPLKIAGFSVTNVVTVRILNLSILGDVLDELTGAGANRVQSVLFAIADPAPLKDVARQRAVKEALRRARLIAKAAGVGLGPIQSIEELGRAAPPTFRAMGVQASSAIPLAEGELTVSAIVRMKFAIN